jgi:hypothetical protein
MKRKIKNPTKKQILSRIWLDSDGYWYKAENKSRCSWPAYYIDGRHVSCKWFNSRFSKKG